MLAAIRKNTQATMANAMASQMMVGTSTTPNAPTLIGLGDALRSAGDLQGARASYLQAAELDPSNQ